MDAGRNVYRTASRELDWEQVRVLAEDHCTADEIAGYVGISLRTLERRCQEIYNTSIHRFIKQYRNRGKANLRSIQFGLASLNASMAKHLGIQYLGQSDKVIINKEEEQEEKYDYTKLTNEELETLEFLLRKCSTTHEDVEIND
jgi:hypothetical protein